MLDILIKITGIGALVLGLIYSTLTTIYYVIIPLYQDIKNGVFRDNDKK